MFIVSWISLWSSIKSFSWSDQFIILQLKYRERVLGLILISPLCKSPSWSEWFYNKVAFSSLFIILALKYAQVLIHVKYHISLVIAGNVKLVILLWHVRFVEGVLASAVLQQGNIVSILRDNLSFCVCLLYSCCWLDSWDCYYMQQEVRGSAEVAESDIVQACRKVCAFYVNHSIPRVLDCLKLVCLSCFFLLDKLRLLLVLQVFCLGLIKMVYLLCQLLDERQSNNVLRFLQAINR